MWACPWCEAKCICWNLSIFRKNLIWASWAMKHLLDLSPTPGWQKRAANTEGLDSRQQSRPLWRPQGLRRMNKECWFIISPQLCWRGVSNATAMCLKAMVKSVYNSNYMGFLDVFFPCLENPFSIDKRKEPGNRCCIGTYYVPYPQCLSPSISLAEASEGREQIPDGWGTNLSLSAIFSPGKEWSSLKIRIVS